MGMLKARSLSDLASWLGKSAGSSSVRDRGVGGSNPLAPTSFPHKNCRIQSGRPLGFARVVSSSNPLQQVSQPQDDCYGGKSLGCC